MKILHVITGLENNGAEGALFRLATTDAANTHEVVSLSGEGHYGPLLSAAGIPVHALGMRRGRLTPSGIATLFRLVKRIRPDVVQTWMYHADLVGGVVSRAAGARTVIWGIRHSDLDPQKTSLSTRLVARACALLSWSIPRHIVCCSEASRRVHAALGYKATMMTVIVNGYDLERFAPDDAARRRTRTALGFREEEFVTGTVGRWHPQKDHATLFAAIARLSTGSDAKLRCLLVGPGMSADNGALGLLLDRWGVRDTVVLLGSRPDVPDLMNALDVHVLSSSFGEGFPNVVAEAMACGTPALTTDIGDAAFIVADTGYVVPKGDPDRLAQALRVAMAEKIRQPDKWAARRLACRLRVRDNFSLARMVRNYGALWDRAAVAEQRQPRG